MCKWDSDIPVIIKGKEVKIDSCLAILIDEMNRAGIETLASCCGHFKTPGIIAIKNGGVDIILPQLKEML